MRSPAGHHASPAVAAPGVLDGGRHDADAQERGASVDLDRGHQTTAAQRASAPVDTLPPAVDDPPPVRVAPGATLTPGRGDPDAHMSHAGGTLEGDQVVGVTPETDPSPESEGNGHPGRDARATTTDPSDALLLILADSLNDVEGLRKATGNQLSALTRDAGVPGGKGLSEFSRAAVLLADRLALLEQFEHKTELELKRALRTHPLGQWVKTTVGIGEKQGARLIAAIGDPYMRPRMEYDDGTVEEARPRLVSELRSYCGYGDASKQKRRKGVQSNWNAEAKMRAFLCAESCMKQRTSPFRAVYDAARANWAERDTSDGHKHAHALRCVAKAILKDLWLAARVVDPPEPKGHAPVSANGGSA